MPPKKYGYAPPVKLIPVPNLDSKLLFEVAGAQVKKGRGISMIIYADPGVGKTTLATTLPGDETLIINVEAGLGAILGKGHSIFYLKDDLSQLDQLYKHIRTEKHPWKYVVVDNISELENWIVNVLYKGRGKDFPELSEYGDASSKMREYLHLFRDLVEMGITVIFNAWEMNIEIKNAGGEVVTKTCPRMFKKISAEVCGLVDMVGHLECWEKTGDRWIRFHPQKNLIAKTGFKGISAEEPPDLPQLLEKIYSYDYTKTEEENG